MFLMTFRPWRSAILCLTVWAWATAALAQDTPPTLRDELLGPVETVLQEARKLGAAKHCPRSFEAAVALLTAAEQELAADPNSAEQGEMAALIADAALQAELVMERILFIRELRDERHGWEAAAVHYDQLVGSVARNADIQLPVELCGLRAGRAVADSLSEQRFRHLALVDSLSYRLRDLEQWIGMDKPAQDSLITQQQREITELRHQVWDLEIRLGVAEADRDKALHQIQQEIARRELVRSLADLFAIDEGQIILTPDGDVRVVLVGLKFSSGSAWLNPNYDPLLDRLAEVIERFPNSPLTVEGHTDNTGSRETNQALSQERAQRVAEALASRIELSSDLLTVVGVGPDRPLADNNSTSGRARNRRIEVIVAAGQH